MNSISNHATSDPNLPTGAPEHDACGSALSPLPCRSSLLRKGALPRMLLVLAFALAFLAYPLESKAAITQVRKSSGSAMNDSTVTATYSGTPSADNLLIAIVGARSSVTINTPTGTGWLTAINGSLTTPSQSIFY